MFYRKKWKFRDGRYFLNVTQHTGVQKNTCSSDERGKEPKLSLQSPFWEPTLLFPHLVSLHRFAWGSRPLCPNPTSQLLARQAQGKGVGSVPLVSHV